MKTIIVTGSVSSGKTTVSRKLAKKLNLKYIDVNKLIKEEKLGCGYDKKRKCKIIDVNILNESLIKLIKNSKQNLIIDSHLSHYLPNRYVDLCIVTKCRLRILEKRLKKRNYDENKVKENLTVEIFDTCLNEAKALNHNVLVIDTTKGINMGNLASKIKVLLK